MNSHDAAEVRDALVIVEESASIIHDYLYGLGGVDRDRADEEIWRIHHTVRPLIDPTGETWRKESTRGR